MSLTRAATEADLVSRAKKKMALVGFAVTSAGSNADLNTPLATALRKMGKIASTPVSDADLAGLEDDEINEFLDRAELRLIESILGNYDLTNYTTGPRSESLDQIAAELQKSIDRKEAFVKRTYGEGGPSLEGGNIRMDSQAHMTPGESGNAGWTGEWPL